MPAFTTNAFNGIQNDSGSVGRQAKRIYNRWTGAEAEAPKIYPAETDLPTYGIEAVNLAARFIEDSMLGIEDPAFDFCLVQLDFAATSGLLADVAHAGEPAYVDSAASYFKRIGDTERLDMLGQVQQLLKDIFNAVDTPQPYRRGYIVKSINGLNGLVENARKPGTYVDLSIDCIDTILWQIRAVNGLLDQILWDYERQVEALPINLRQFNVIMTIKDVRDVTNFTYTPTVDTWSEKKPDAGQVEQNKSQLIFGVYEGNTVKAWQSMIVTCKCCEFKPKFLPDAVSNADPVEMQQSLTFTTPVFSYSMLIPALDAVITAPIVKENSKEVDKWATVKSAAVGILAGYVNAMYDQGKAMLMNGAYKLLEQSQVLKYANNVMKYTKGSFGTQELLGLMSKNAAEQAIRDAYFGDTKILETKHPADKQYAKLNEKTV